MIIKSTIAGLTLGATAFGGVYYGLPTVTPVNGITPSEVERIEPIMPKTENLRDGAIRSAGAGTHPHPERKAEPAKPKAKASPDPDNAVAGERVTEESQEKPDPQKKWLDQYLKPDGQSDDADKADGAEPKQDAKQDVWDAHSAANRQAREQYFKLHSGDQNKDSEVKQTERVEKIMPDEVNPYIGDRADIIKIVLKEASAIKSSELRDQAYMSVVDYALERRNFNTALDVLGKIKQPELRETARSNIAIGYARAGQPQAAFNLVDEVELDDFQDVMRLQVIEALVNPKPRADITK